MQKFTTFIKQLIPILLVMAVVFGVMNVSSYDPRNELATFVPAAVLATVDSSSVGQVVTGPNLPTPPELNPPNLPPPPGLNPPSLPPPPNLPPPPVPNPPTLPPPTATSCVVTASAPSVVAGASVTISWQTQGFASVTLNGAAVASNGSQIFTNLQNNTSYTLVARSADGKSNCTAVVTVVCVPAPVPVLPPECVLSPASQIIAAGTTATLTWSTQNARSATLTDFGVVPLSGVRTTPALFANKTYTLIVVGNDNSTITCVSHINVTELPPPPTPAPTCVLTPGSQTITFGGTATLTWSTQNARSATLSTFGSVPLSGSRTVTPSINTVYALTVLGVNGATINCTSSIHVNTPPPTPAPKCVLTPSSQTITAGGTATLTWSTQNAESANLTNFGAVALSGSRTITPSTNTSYTLTVLGDDGTTITCVSHINVTQLPLPVPTCLLTPASQTITVGGTATLTWSTQNASSASLTTFGAVPLSGSRTVTPTTNTNYTLTVLGLNGTTITCLSHITVTQLPPPTPLPTCEFFTASPTSVVRGASSTLAWSTKDTSRVVINNGIGEVAATGSISVTPQQTTTYTLTAFGKINEQNKVTCTSTVTVTDVPPPPPPAPFIKCESFTASPATLPVKGGQTVLAWTVVTNASMGTPLSVTINPIVGAVSLVGSTTVNVSTTTTFTLSTTLNINKSDACFVTVTVAPPVPPNPVPFTCGNNVTVSANPTSIVRGDSSTLTWNTTGVTSVSFDQGIVATGLSGSVTVSPTTNTTYTMTARNGTSTIACPVSVAVSTPPGGGGGGGGGGSSSPTCELSVSNNRIDRGQNITLRWDSKRASDVVIRDSNGATIVNTKNLLSSEKDRLFSGSVRLSPTTDTVYTMTVERGSRDRICTARVSLDNSLVVTQIRDQQPLVAGIALSQVPYTGFEAGPLLTFMFYLLLLAWALYMAYILVIRRDMLAGYQLAMAKNHIVAAELTPEQIRPDVFVPSIRTPDTPPLSYLPMNLPAGIPIVGYANAVSTHIPAVITSPVLLVTTPAQDIETQLENHAHAKKALLSSDAIRQLIATTSANSDRFEALDQVIADAKTKYPTEDGWLVINEERMRSLCVDCNVVPMSAAAPYVPTVIREGSGSLAEAIVTGNVIAAYEMIGHRPMFALADAAADLDSVYRLRRGAEASVSELLQTEAANLSDEQIVAMIKALTGALDGVYTDEASAVKMAIMKAVKVVA